MKLLTHNMLTSQCINRVKTGYPLTIVVKDLKVLEVDFNPDFIIKLLPKIDWGVLRTAAESVGHLSDLPEQPIAEYENNEEFLRKAHHALLEIDVINGELVCPETGRKFPINDGIPNMLLNEDEV